MTDDLDALAKGLTKAQREAVREGRVHDCPYNHPDGTRCPNCAGWPFRKGEAANFVTRMRAHLEKNNED